MRTSKLLDLIEKRQEELDRLRGELQTKRELHRLTGDVRIKRNPRSTIRVLRAWRFRYFLSFAGIRRRIGRGIVCLRRVLAMLV